MRPSKQIWKAADLPQLKDILLPPESEETEDIKEDFRRVERVLHLQLKGKPLEECNASCCPQSSLAKYRDDALCMGDSVAAIRTQDNLSIVVTNYHINWLASYYTGEAVFNKKGRFKVKLEFEGVRNLTQFFESNKKLKRYCTPIEDSFPNQIGFDAIHEFELGESENLYLMNIHPRWYYRKEGHYSPYGLYSTFWARKVSIYERYRQEWIEIFGEESVFIFDKFQEIWPNRHWGALKYETFLRDECGLRPLVGNYAIERHPGQYG